MMSLGVGDEFVNLGNTEDFENTQYFSCDENVQKGATLFHLVKRCIMSTYF